jgi:hypothetical protein
VGHVVVDANGEAAAGLVLFKLPVDREYIRRGRVLGGQAVAAAADLHAEAARVGQRRRNVQIEGLALAARLLGAVQHGHLSGTLRDGLHQLVRAEGAEQPHLHQADLLPLRRQVIHDLLGRVAHGAHGHYDPLGVGRAVIVEEPVVGADGGVYPRHAVLHHPGQGVVIPVGRLPVLENMSPFSWEPRMTGRLEFSARARKAASASLSRKASRSE